MSPSFAVWLFGLVARLPLAALHRIGVFLGWVTYRVSAKYAERLRANFEYACADHPQKKLLLNDSVGEAGKALIELPWVWCRPLAQVMATVKVCAGWELVEAARAQGKGLLFLTPHMGCFEVSGLYIAERMPITVLYRPPRLAWLEQVMRKGRERSQMRLARTDMSGVRLLFKALKRGEAIGLLPDQVPGAGEGEWAQFFGRPAYTMTLVGRLLESTGAIALMIYVERLPRGEGYVIRFTALDFVPSVPITQQINAALEKVVRACPAQYLWSYNRYKIPAGMEPPESHTKMKQAGGET